MAVVAWLLFYSYAELGIRRRGGGGRQGERASCGGGRPAGRRAGGEGEAGSGGWRHSYVSKGAIKKVVKGGRGERERELSGQTR